MRNRNLYWYQEVFGLVIIGLGCLVGFALTGFLLKIVYNAFMFGWNKV